MIRLAEKLVSVSILFMSTGGCDSSLQVPKNQDELARLNDTDAVNGQVYDDVSDERRLPFVCEEASECDDLDLCTRDRCQKKRCNYSVRSLTLKAYYAETTEPAVDVSILDTRRFYVAMGTGGVESFDISDPTSPSREENSLVENVNAVSIEAGRDGVALCIGDGGLYALNFSLGAQYRAQPDTGILRGVDEVYNFDTGPRYRFTSGFIDGFLVHSKGNILDQSSMTLVAAFDTIGRVYRVASTDRLAVVADALGGALVYGFDTETGIAQVSKLPTEGRMMDVDVVGDTLIMAEYGKGFALVDLSDMNEPKRLADVYTDHPVTVARLMGSQTAVIGEENGRISLYDVSLNVTGEKRAEDDNPEDDVAPERIAVATPRAPILLDSVKLKGAPLRIDVENDLIAVALGENGVALLTTGCVQEEADGAEDTDTVDEAI